MTSSDLAPSYPPALSLAGPQAVVIGGTRGLGAAVVDRLVEAGARVVAVGRSEPEATRAARIVRADVTSPSSAGLIARAVIEEGGLDKGLANELAPRRIRVNTVSPGGIQSESAVGLARRIAEAHGVDEQTGMTMLMDSLGGIPDGRGTVKTT
jgi:NAD(P)-dependent dehydrogenase (short-subunit alcohol dehydrogenase family)